MRTIYGSTIASVQLVRTYTFGFQYLVVYFRGVTDCVSLAPFALVINAFGGR